MPVPSHTHLLALRFFRKSMPRATRFPVLRSLALAICLFWLIQYAWHTSRKRTTSSRGPQEVEQFNQDRFTIVIATYKRLAILPRILSAYTSGNLPSLAAIILVWQDTESEPPLWLEDFSSLEIPLHVRRSKRNSMNERFRLDDRIQTQSVFMVDDDLFIQSTAIEHAFGVWKELGRDSRIVGFTARDYRMEETSDGAVRYGFDLLPQQTYSMILSNAVFMDRSFHALYWEERNEKYRKYVDKVFNCDDLLINFLVSNKTGLAPILVQPVKGIMSYPDARGGLVERPDHWPMRSACVDDFAKMMGKMPLVKSSWSVSADVRDHAAIAESDEDLVDDVDWHSE